MTPPLIVVIGLGAGILAVAWLPLRLPGPLYYMSFAADRGLENPKQLWAVVALALLVSIGAHGVSATPLMRRLDAQRRPRPRDDCAAAPSVDPAAIETGG